MAKTYKFGVVGCGVIAPNHIESILSVENCEVIALCDVVKEKAQELAEKYNVKRIYTDYNELVKEQDVDIVCVCTPSGQHGEVTIAAANAGKHVFCEKPIEITKEKMDAMIKAVRENGVKMGCVFGQRTKPVSIAVKKAVEEGKLGKVILADAYLKRYRSPEYYKSAGWRGTWEFDGGGALMNQCIHGIDILIWIAGDVESVFAKAVTQVRDIEVEDTAVAVIRFKNGAVGVLEGATSVYPQLPQRCEIHGEKGTIAFDGNGIYEWKIEGSDEQAPQIKKNDAAVKNSKYTRTSHHRELIKDLAQAIKEDREPMIPPEDARRAVDLILAIYESGRTGKEIKPG